MVRKVVTLAASLTLAVLVLQGQDRPQQTSAPKPPPNVAAANSGQSAPSGVPPLWSQWASFAANVATPVGIVIAVIVFVRDRRRERRQREVNAYLALSSIYHDHLSFCFDHPNLSSVECDAADEKGLHRERDQDIFGFMVINMLEAAYFQYREQGTKFRAAQWSGWNAYMEMWVRHPEFGKRLPDSVEMFDHEFGEHIRTLYANATKDKQRKFIPQ